MRPTSALIGDASEPLGSPRPRRKLPISYRSVGVVVMLTDVFIILFSGVIAGILYSLQAFGTPGEILQYLGPAAVVAALFVAVMKGHGLYSPAELLDLRTQVGSATTVWLSVFLFLFGAVFALKIGDQFSRVTIFSFVIGGLGLLIVERVLWRILLRRGLSGQLFSGRNAVLITDHAPAAGSALVHSLQKFGIELNRQFVLKLDQQDPEQQEAVVSDIVAFLRGSDIEEVIVSMDLKHWGSLKQLFSGLRMLPLPVNLIPVGEASEILSRPLHVMGDSICIELQREPLDGLERGVKRCIDAIGALAGLILLAPLLAITAVMIKLESPGPILFRQRRCGFSGKPFNIYKFRTMSVLEDGPTVDQATRADCRVTRVGKLLRRASIDELPQLLNVLNGSMSLVGPRPHALAHDNHFDKVVRNYAFRHHVKPGLTGWAQVHGHRGPTPTVADIRKRVEFDLWYIDNWSLRLDFLIILRTVVEVMRARNAY
jgi:putative colanic acid biosynthesis UDP-glucose lipid carrier transferase